MLLIIFLFVAFLFTRPRCSALFIIIHFLLLIEKNNLHNQLHTFVFENCKLVYENIKKSRLIGQKDEELLSLSEQNTNSQLTIVQLKATAEKQRNEINQLKKQIQELNCPPFVNDLIRFNEPSGINQPNERISFTAKILQRHATNHTDTNSEPSVGGSHSGTNNQQSTSGSLGEFNSLNYWSEMLPNIMMEGNNLHFIYCDPKFHITYIDFNYITDTCGNIHAKEGDSNVSNIEQSVDILDGGLGQADTACGGEIEPICKDTENMNAEVVEYYNKTGLPSDMNNDIKNNQSNENETTTGFNSSDRVHLERNDGHEKDSMPSNGGVMANEDRSIFKWTKLC